MKVGDLVRILRSGEFAIVIGFDMDNDPIVGGFVQRPPHHTDPSPMPECRSAVEVINESR